LKSFDTNVTEGSLINDDVLIMPVPNADDSEATKKRRNSSNNASSGSPGKKRRGSAENTTAPSTEVDEVDFTRAEGSSDRSQRSSPKVKSVLAWPPISKNSSPKIDWGSSKNFARTSNLEFDKATESKLAQLRDMGFPNEERNTRVLKECYGDMSLATEALTKTSPVNSDAEALADEDQQGKLSTSKAPVLPNPVVNLQNSLGFFNSGFFHASPSKTHKQSKNVDKEPISSLARQEHGPSKKISKPQRHPYVYPTELATDELRWIHKLLQAARDEKGNMDGDAIKAKKSADKGKGREGEETPKTWALLVLAAFQDVKEELVKEVRRKGG
jgi:hypothetical protein